ncbi:MAG: DegQ family serine endoprotease [Thermodesulfovibrionales bacterium]|nr:DegQ family serine endoprotease [Thermodesulfovibrionales bacterium]
MASYKYITIILFFILIFSPSGSLIKPIFAEEPKVSKEAIDILTKAGQAMAEVVNIVRPAVVNISTTRILRGGSPNPFFDDPFFRKFFGDEFDQFKKRKERRNVTLGSGVIVDKNGYILTNNHVIKGADEIIVRLSDKREFKGRVIGTDPKSDIAVIKIDSDRLPTIKWGDSSKLRVGETVIAIGNPFGLNQTVTSGIVSATGRANVGITDYEDFIQTDAAINPGNSGGALVNVRGELIGINTAIFSTSGGYQGIGFAIPSNMAKSVMESLIKKGKVVRGWLGITVQQLTPELAKQFNAKEEKGVLVVDVTPKSPAEKAGILRGDIIIEFDGKEINDPSYLRNLTAITPPDKEVSVKIIRNSTFKNLKVLISELPQEGTLASEEQLTLLSGVHLQEISPELRKQLQIPAKVNGILVSFVEPNSKAKGVLKQYDIITEINKKKISNLVQYRDLIPHIKHLRQLTLNVFRNGEILKVLLR